MREKRGQVWVETVTYTLIALVLIGLILAFVKPKINELQDKALIEQSLTVMKNIDSVINEVYQDGVGNKRLLQVSVSKGDLTLNSTTNSITFLYTGTYMYSQPGTTYNDGSFSITTTKVGPEYKILIEKDYPNFDFTYSGEEVAKTLSSSSSNYQLFITNKGGSGNNIDFSLQ
jgi:type II secretory pathway pseudopilin PulG